MHQSPTSEASRHKQQQKETWASAREQAFAVSHRHQQLRSEQGLTRHPAPKAEARSHQQQQRETWTSAREQAFAVSRRHQQLGSQRGLTPQEPLPQKQRPSFVQPRVRTSQGPFTVQQIAQGSFQAANARASAEATSDATARAPGYQSIPQNFTSSATASSSAAAHRTQQRKTWLPHQMPSHGRAQSESAHQCAPQYQTRQQGHASWASSNWHQQAPRSAHAQHHQPHLSVFKQDPSRRQHSQALMDTFPQFVTAALQQRQRPDHQQQHLHVAQPLGNTTHSANADARVMSQLPADLSCLRAAQRMSFDSCRQKPHRARQASAAAAASAAVSQSAITMHPQPGALAIELPDDVWQRVSDYLQSTTLSEVCSKLWGLLQGQHLQLGIASISQMTSKMPKWKPAIRSLEIVSNMQLALDADLQLLNLEVHHEKVDDRGAQALASALKDAPQMHALYLNLSDNSVGSVGAYALATLKSMPSLQILCLNLSGNSMYNSSAESLAALRDAPLLHTLHLDLSSNAVKDSGAEALAALKKAPSLRVLSLNIGHTQVGDVGAQALAGLKDAVRLHSLHLNLKDTEVGSCGAEALATLKDAPLLHTLSLDMRNNYLGSRGRAALAEAALANMPHVDILWG